MPPFTLHYYPNLFIFASNVGKMILWCVETAKRITVLFIQSSKMVKAFFLLTKYFFCRLRMRLICAFVYRIAYLGSGPFKEKFLWLTHCGFIFLILFLILFFFLILLCMMWLWHCHAHAWSLSLWYMIQRMLLSLC